MGSSEVGFEVTGDALGELVGTLVTGDRLGDTVGLEVVGCNVRGQYQNVCEVYKLIHKKN